MTTYLYRPEARAGEPQWFTEAPGFRKLLEPVRLYLGKRGGMDWHMGRR